MTDLEILEAAARLGRKLERLEAEKAEAQRDWQVRLDARFAAKRESLLAGAPAEVLAKLGIAR